MIPWSDVAKSEGYQALRPHERFKAQIQYFNDVLAQKIPEEHRRKSKIQFLTDVSEEKKYSPTDDMSTFERTAAGAGKAAYDIARGLGQVAGVVDQDNVDEARRLDAPLMDTTAGKVGNIAGSVAVAAPVALAPGANTAVGAALIGGGMGFAQPVATGESRAENTTLGAAFGVGGHAVGKTVGAGMSAAKNKIASLTAQKAQNAARDAVVKSAQEAGHVLPPSFSGGSLPKRMLEGIAGKASVKQAASNANQDASEKAVRAALGIGDDVPLSPAIYDSLKKQAWDVYDEMRSLGTFTADRQFFSDLSKASTTPGRLGKNAQIDDLVSKLKTKTADADDVISDIMELRSNANTRLSKLNTDPASKALGRAERKIADALEGLIERNIAPSKLGAETLKRFREARTLLAKIHDIEKSTVKNAVDMRKLAKTTTGKLDPNVKASAEFAKTFPELNQGRVSQVIGGTPLDVFGSVGAVAMTDDPRYLALMALRPAARKAVLWKPFSSMPSYKPGIAARGASQLDQLYSQMNPRARQILEGMRGSVIPAVSFAQE